jgi:DNA invertase Pin-like site-specific DNA recombinase
MTRSITACLLPLLCLLTCPTSSQGLIKISENTKAALAKKKAASQKLGAPAKDAAVVAQVRQLKAAGASNQAIARVLKMSPSTVAKYVS